MNRTGTGTEERWRRQRLATAHMEYEVRQQCTEYNDDHGEHGGQQFLLAQCLDGTVHVCTDADMYI